MGWSNLAEEDLAMARELSRVRPKNYPYADKDGDGVLSESED